MLSWCDEADHVNIATAAQALCCLLLQVAQMCEYLSELCLVDVTTNKHPLSLLSAAVLHVALNALGRADTYPRALAKHARYRLEDVMPAAR